MRYATLKKTQLRRYRIDKLDGGLQLNSNIDSIDDNRLSDCLNVWYEGGALTTRPAFRAVGKPLESVSAYEITKEGLVFTDAVYIRDGVKYNLAYFVTGDDYSFVRLHLYFVNDSGERLDAGVLHFGRTSSDTFYVPQSICFVVGNPTTAGSGIYALVTRKSGSLTAYSIYELDSALENWADCQNKFYIPVLYIDGQGTRYGEAKTALGLSYPAPQSPEQRNLLTGWFKAYFTSDSFSSVFRLPIANLDEVAVNCRVYSDSQNYTQWVIPAGSNSVTESLGGREITMKCDRKAGVISFFEGGSDFSVPIMPYCSSNNIVIRACKEIAGGIASIVSSKRSLSFDSRIYLCDNDIKPNEVYSAKLSNPLYFPKGARAAAGESTSSVLALGVQNNKIIAFKAGETYRIDVNDGASLKDTAILDESDELQAGDDLCAVAISKDIGCDCPNTVLRCGNRLVWANSGGQIFMLATTTYGKENNIYEVSLPVSKRLSLLGRAALKSAFALKFGGYYMLFINNMVWLMNYRVKSFGYNSQYEGDNSPAENISWYYWEAPSAVRLTSGMSGNNNIVVGALDNEGLWNYCMFLGGTRDLIIESDDIKYSLKESAIKAELSTGLLSLGFSETGKRIESVSLELAVEGVGTVALFNRGRTHSFNAAPRGDILRLTSIRALTDKIGVRVASDSGLRLGSVTFKYRLLSDLG